MSSQSVLRTGFFDATISMSGHGEMERKSTTPTDLAKHSRISSEFKLKKTWFFSSKLAPICAVDLDES